MAKKRSESRRFNTLVRLDDEVAAKAKKVAALKEIAVADYLTEIIRPVVDRDLAKELKKLSGQTGAE